MKEKLHIKSYLQGLEDARKFENLKESISIEEINEHLEGFKSICAGLELIDATDLQTYTKFKNFIECIDILKKWHKIKTEGDEKRCMK